MCFNSQVLFDQGPPGAGNLSQCEHKVTSMGTGLGTDSFSTPWIPSNTDHQVSALYFRN